MSVMTGAARSFVVGLTATLASVALYLLPGMAQEAPRLGPDLYSRLHWRFIGPEGNRSDAAAGVPGNPNIYYVGSASGGIYRTTDGGIHWDPIFDDQIGDLMSGDVAAFNDMLRRANSPIIVTHVPARPPTQ